MKFKYIIIISILILLESDSLKAQNTFKRIAYYMPEKPVLEIPFRYLTHINYSFAIPALHGDTLETIKNDSLLIALVRAAHLHRVKVFISIGGWSIGDGGGEDARFHKMAATTVGRQKFVISAITMVDKYNLDGIDLDWEYPDPESQSADDFVKLCKNLHVALHAKKKQLSAAVVSSGKQAYGIKNEVYPYIDWLNLMVYDGDYGPTEVKHHSPYSMAVNCLDFWLNDRQLPTKKCVLGLPFYAKKGHGNFGYPYNKLLSEGASPLDDYWNGHYYNGKITISNKTKLALQRHCAGVMVWEMSHDTDNENSLFKVIDSVSKGKEGWK